MAELLRLADRRRPARVVFSRDELNRLLSLYSRRVAAGEWRDYAIDHDEQAAAFSVFRSSFERPILSVVKRRATQARDGGFVLMSRGVRLGESADIAELLSLIERRPHLVV
jgi:hypothetical protein